MNGIQAMVRQMTATLEAHPAPIKKRETTNVPRKTISAIKRMRAKGIPMTEIVKITGVSKSTVFRAIRLEREK